MKWRWWVPASVPEPRHVRVHVLHEGRPSGDLTVEGFEAVAPAAWYWLDRATLVLEDQRIRLEGGRFEVPFSRVVGVEPLVAISVELPALPAAVGDNLGYVNEAV